MVKLKNRFLGSIHSLIHTLSCMQMDHTLFMKIQQGIKLSRHGVHSVVQWLVIIVVVAELSVGVRVYFKWPETIQMDVVAEL